MTDFTLKAEDTSPALTVELQTEDGTVVDVTGADVRFHMSPRDSPETTVVDKAAVVVDGPNGMVEYRWAAEDTAESGRYWGEFEVTYDDGAVESFPNEGYISIQIHDQLA